MTSTNGSVSAGDVRQPRTAMRLDALVTILIAAGMALVAVRSWRSALALAALPIGLWIGRTRLTWIIWALSLEMALGGWGHFLSIGSLPLRHALLAAALGTWIVNKVVDGDWHLRGRMFAWAASIFLAFVLVTVLISLSLGNPYALEDGLTPAFLLLLFPFSDIAVRPGGTRWLLRVFVLSVLVLALVQIASTVGILIGVIGPGRLAAEFNLRLGGVTQISGSYWRVFLVGSIFFQVAILLIAATKLAGQVIVSRRWDLLALGAIVVALLFTYTRGFWLTTIIGLLTLAWLTTAGGRVKWMTGALVAALAAIVLLQVGGISVVDVFVQRFLLLFNPDKDISVALRVDLYPRLLTRIAQRPLFGYGFGLPVENQLYYENSYLYYLIKFGIVGLAVLAWGWILLLVEGTRIVRGPFDHRARAYAAGVVAATVSMLAVTNINPFINSAMGLYFQALGSAILLGLRADATRLRAVATPMTRVDTE